MREERRDRSPVAILEVRDYRTVQGLRKRQFLEGGAPVPAQNSRPRAAVETWERLSLEDPESKAREPSEG